MAARRANRAVGEQGGAEPAAGEGAEGEASEAEDAHDQPLLVAPEAHREHKNQDQPVEAGHGSRIQAHERLTLRT